MPPAPPQAKPVPSQNSSDDIMRPSGNRTSITRQGVSCTRPVRGQVDWPPVDPCLAFCRRGWYHYACMEEKPQQSTKEVSAGPVQSVHLQKQVVGGLQCRTWDSF